MNRLRPYRECKDMDTGLFEYCMYIAKYFHGNRKRWNGKLEFNHLREVNEISESVLLHPDESDIYATLLHDIIETFGEKQNIHIFNPYSPYETTAALRGEAEGKRYLNFLFPSPFGLGELSSQGRHICYVVRRITHYKDRESKDRESKDSESYNDYSKRIFNLENESFLLKILKKAPLIRKLNVKTVIYKIGDFRSNIDPEEIRNIENIIYMDPILKEYRDLRNAGREEREEFLDDKWILGYFKRRDIFDYDEGTLKDACCDMFRGRRITFARTFLAQHLPNAEDSLIINMPDNEIYNKTKVRNMLKDIARDALTIVRENDLSPENFDRYTDSLYMMGDQRDREIEGTILQELREEMIKEKHDENKNNNQ